LAPEGTSSVNPSRQSGGSTFGRSVALDGGPLGRGRAGKSTCARATAQPWRGRRSSRFMRAEPLHDCEYVLLVNHGTLAKRKAIEEREALLVRERADDQRHSSGRSPFCGRVADAKAGPVQTIGEALVAGVVPTGPSRVRRRCHFCCQRAHVARAVVAPEEVNVVSRAALWIVSGHHFPQLTKSGPDRATRKRAVVER